MDEIVTLAHPTQPCDQDTFVPSQFRISVLIRLSLWSLYIALMLPLPFLAHNPLTSKVSWVELGGALVSGAILLHMVLTEQVRVDDAGIGVYYPKWVPQWFRRGWALSWSDIVDLKARSTGQGGLVYYLVSQDRSGYLLPMRIAGFSRMLQLIQLKTNLDIRDVKPLAQPWMYAMLLVAALLMAIADIWIIWTAFTLAQV
jgi:hypothetical protein